MKVRLGPRTLEVRIETRPRSISAANSAVLTHDVRRSYGTWASGGTCRIRIFESDRCPPVIVCTQLESTPGAGIHAFAEFLAASVVGKYFPHRFDEPVPAIWIEHHPATDTRSHNALDIAQVTFATWKPTIQYHPTGWRAKIGNPSRTPITTAELEALVGELGIIWE